MDNEEQLTIRAMLRNEVSGPLQQLRRELEAAEKRINATNANLTAGANKAEKATRKTNSALNDLKKTAAAPTWSQVGAQFNGMASGLNRATSSATSLTTMVGTRLAGAAAIGLGAVTAYGLKSAGAIESMKVSLTTMFGTDGGNRLFAQLQQLANFTPFSTQQQIQGAQILGAYGIAENQLVGLSKAISDVASASSDPELALHGISLALGQVQAKGKVAGQEIIQLANFQVPALQILASEYGKTTAEIQHMLDTGTTFDAGPFLQYFQKLEGPLGKFQGMSEKQSKTLRGVWSTFTSELQQSTATAFAPAAEQVKEFLPGFGKELAGVVNQAGPDLASITGSLLQMATPFVRILNAIGAPTLRFFANTLISLQPSVNKMAGDAPMLAKSMGEFWTAMEPVVPSLGELLQQMPPLLASFGEMGASAIPSLLVPMLEFANVVLRLVNSSPLLRDALVAATIATWGLNGAFTALKGIATIVETLKGVGMAVDLLTGKYNALTAAEVRSAEAAALGGGPAGAAGGLTKLGKAAGLAGGVGLGGFGIYEGAKADPGSAGSAAGLIGGTALVGATIGSVVPGLGTALGGLAGGLAGGAAYGVGRLMGDTASPWGRTLSMSNAADAMTPGSRGITSGVRNYGISPGSDHASGHAIDRHGSWMQSYAHNIRRIGGYATVHDSGGGRHVHAAFGDTASPMSRSTGGGPGGGDWGPGILITGNTFSTNIDLERTLNDAMDRRDRRKRERT